MDPAKLPEVKQLEAALMRALDNLTTVTTAPHPAGLDIAGLLAWLTTDLPGVIAAVAKLIGILMTQGD